MITGKNNEPGKNSGASANGAYSKRHVTCLNLSNLKDVAWLLPQDFDYVLTWTWLMLASLDNIHSFIDLRLSDFFFVTVVRVLLMVQVKEVKETLKM